MTTRSRVPVALALAVVLGGCHAAPAPGSAVAERDNADEAARVTDDTPQSGAREDGATVLAEGTFEVSASLEPLSPPGSKLAEQTGLWLTTDAGERWLLSSGGPADSSELDGRRLRVTGRVIEPSPYVAHLGVPHFELDSWAPRDLVPELATDMQDGFETRYSDTIEFFEATVRIDAQPGGKQFQGVWLDRDGGTTYLVAYRPQPELAALEGQRVEVAGRRKYPGPMTQHVQADHFELDHIAAVPSDAPSFTGDAQTLEGTVELPDGGKSRVLVMLVGADDSETILRYGRTPAWEALAGKRVRVTGRPFVPGHPQQASGPHLWPDTLIVLGD